MPLLKTSYIQGKSQGSIEKNLKYYSKKIREASKKNVKLIVLPELFLWDYFPVKEDKKNFDLAITIDSKEVKHFRNLAKELKIVLTLPIFEKSTDGKFYNSVLVIEKTGEIIGHYRKLHIPYDPGFYEKFYFTPGDKGYVVCNTSIGKIGVLICFDQWFPEAARACALKGAELIIYPTAIGWDENEPCRGLRPQVLKKEQLEAWININRSHAIANNVYVLVVNRVGQEKHLNFWGKSFVCNPYGKIICECGNNEEMSFCDINFDLIKDCRKVWTFIRDRRNDTYEALLK